MIGRTLERLIGLSVSRVATGLGVSWSAANAAILAEGKRRLIDDPHSFDGVTTIGVDEHVWRRTRKGDKYVTVVAMDGLSGFKTAAAKELPDAVPVMDPFHVVRLAGDGLDRCRQRVQRGLHLVSLFRHQPRYLRRCEIIHLRQANNVRLGRQYESRYALRRCSPPCVFHAMTVATRTSPIPRSSASGARKAMS